MHKEPLNIVDYLEKVFDAGIVNDWLEEYWFKWSEYNSIQAVKDECLLDCYDEYLESFYDDLGNEGADIEQMLRETFL